MSKANRAKEAERPKLEIPDGFVTEKEKKVIAAACAVLRSVSRRYADATREARGVLGYAPTITLQVNACMTCWKASSGRDTGEAATLLQAVKNLADLTDADRMLREALDLRRKANNLENIAKRLKLTENDMTDQEQELPGMLALAEGVKAGEWPHTMDAQVWARKWLEITKDKPGVATDEGAMIGWFANAIMAGYDSAMLRSNAQRSTLNAQRSTGETEGGGR